MLSQQIQEFINEIRVLNEVGCLTVPKKNLSQLVTLLKQADLLVSQTPLPGKVMYCTIGPKDIFPTMAKPMIFVVTEEDYSADENWRTRVREVAAYFLNVA